MSKRSLGEFDPPSSVKKTDPTAGTVYVSIVSAGNGDPLLKLSVVGDTPSGHREGADAFMPIGQVIALRDLLTEFLVEQKLGLGARGCRECGAYVPINNDTVDDGAHVSGHGWVMHKVCFDRKLKRPESDPLGLTELSKAVFNQMQVTGPEGGAAAFTSAAPEKVSYLLSLQSLEKVTRASREQILAHVTELKRALKAEQVVYVMAENALRVRFK